MSIEANKKHLDENKALLKELDDLMSYMTDETGSNEEDDLIDPTFFIGKMQSSADEVPTLTSVAEEVNPEEDRNEERQQGLFSARVAEIKEAQSGSSREDKLNNEDIEQIVNTIVAENLPKLENRLREEITARLKASK